jgi:hypothetical protein
MSSSRWSDDAFLDALRHTGDPPADAAVAALAADGGEPAVGRIFRILKANDTPLPADAPAPLHVFMAATTDLPPGTDRARLVRGGEAFLKNALPSVVVLLASSLPRGYAAPCLTEILTISKDLERHPFSRLMGVVQLLLNISDGGAFEPQGRAIVTAQKLRLLHAGVRRITAQYRPRYEAMFGVPVNQEDRLATIMGFSYLLIDGIHRLGLPLKEEEAEDLYYLWQVFARLMGIHPDGRPDDASYIPPTIADAAAFYAAYVRRNDTGPSRNPAGVVLTQDNLTMMRSMIPWPLRLLGLGFAPLIFMAEVMTGEELARVGVTPLVGHRAIKAFLSRVVRLGQDLGEDTRFEARLARRLLQGMVDVDRRGEVPFSIPFSRYDLRGPGFE